MKVDWDVLVTFVFLFSILVFAIVKSHETGYNQCVKDHEEVKDELSS